VTSERFRLHADTVTGCERWYVPAIADDDRLEKVLVEMVDVLDDAILERGTHADVIEDGKVLHVLAEADAARVRADRDIELRGQ
jgi:hypothetical protein